MRAPRLLAATLAALLMVAGCSNDPQPRFADPSETPSPSSSPPSLPSPSQSATAEGAVAFARYWSQLVNDAQRTGQLKDLRLRTSSRCTPCNGVINAIKEPYSSGGRIEGGAWRLSKLRAAPGAKDRSWNVDGVLRVAAQTVIFGTGRRDENKEGRYSVRLLTGWSGERWEVRWLEISARA